MLRSAENDLWGLARGDLREAPMSKVKLEGSNAVSETPLIPLYARAIEQRQAQPLVRDPLAAALMERIDHDWRRIKLTGHDLALAGAGRPSTNGNHL